jgi:thiol-disulfide isomerase/thioredoxin
MNKLLTIEALKIPPINDTPIDKWLTDVKKGMKDVVGFNKGLFYDMLAVNAYTFQMNDKIEPLSKKQIENIKNYFKLNNKEIISILMKNSKEVVKTLENSKDVKINKILTTTSESEKDNHNTNKKELTVTIPGNNNVPIKTYEEGADLKVKDSVPVSKEKLMETIISKYRGKVVLVDFWATWCVPCKEAISEMKPLKAELKDKGVVFVYITDVSSPRIRWEYEIKAIGGEQYYLTQSELNYIIDSIEFKGIPSYLIYNKNGELKHKFNGFPGVDEMREKIKVLLP